MITVSKNNRYRKNIGKYFSFLTANQWSYLALILAVLSAYFIINEKFLVGAVLFAVTGFIDFIDGAVARYKKQATKKGAYLDTILDRYTEAIIIFALMFVSIPTIFPAQLWLFLYLFGSMMTTYAKAASAEKKLVKKELGTGLLQRQDRILLLTAALFSAVSSKVLLGYFIIVLALLSNITALQRIYSSMKR